MNKSIFFSALFFCYVLSLAFQDFMHLSGVWRKVQLPEILFLLLVVSFPLSYFRQYRFEKKDYFLSAILSVYWLANIISSVLSGKFSAIAESFGRLYLIILFGMATLFFAQMSKTTLRDKTINMALILGVLLSLTGIGGIVAHFCGFPSILVGVSEGYPYFGTVYRAQGLTHTPAMLVSLLSFTGILVYTEGSPEMSKKTTAALLLMIIAAILTFSRSVTFLFWGLCLLFMFKKWGFSRKIFGATALMLTLFMTVGTHFIFISKTSPALPSIYASPFTSNKILMEKGNYIALETSYLAIKRASIDIWQTQPIFGIGTGNFVDGLKKMHETGIYPAKLPIYEAHSAYIGTLVENGIFGAVAIIAFLGLLYFEINCFKDLKTDGFSTALLLCLTSVLIESLALDTLNFRHYWLLFALVWAYGKMKNTEGSLILISHLKGPLSILGKNAQKKFF